VVAELHTSKRVRELAIMLRQAVIEEDGSIPAGDYVERLIAERVIALANDLGVTHRTVLERYLTPDQVRLWARTLVAQLHEAEHLANDAPPVEVDQRDGLLVLAAFGVCGVLAMRNADRHQHVDPMVVIKDALDSTVHVSAPLYQANGQPVKIGGVTLVVGRKVINMTIQALSNGWWDCTCSDTHRADGGCALQDRLEHELAVLGGWFNRNEQIAR
jgi:hypothetical protein